MPRLPGVVRRPPPDLAPPDPAQPDLAPPDPAQGSRENYSGLFGRVVSWSLWWSGAVLIV